LIAAIPVKAAQSHKSVSTLASLFPLWTGGGGSDTLLRDCYLATLLSGGAEVAQVNLPDMNAPDTGATLPSD
jgi:hypothetical protein